MIVSASGAWENFFNQDGSGPRSQSCFVLQDQDPPLGYIQLRVLRVCLVDQHIILFAVISSMCNPAAECPTSPPTDVFPEDLVVLRALASPLF